jgi:Recombinase zinc beta ribbon domain
MWWLVSLGPLQIGAPRAPLDPSGTRGCCGRVIAASQGAPREGVALLQGLVWCQQCGARMRVRYSNGAAYYECDYAHRCFGEPPCGVASAKRIDALVENLVLGVIRQGAVDG